MPRTTPPTAGVDQRPPAPTFSLPARFGNTLLIVPTHRARAFVGALELQGFAPWPSDERWHGTRNVYATLRHIEGVFITIVNAESPLWLDGTQPRDGSVLHAWLDSDADVTWPAVLRYLPAAFQVEVQP